MAEVARAPVPVPGASAAADEVADGPGLWEQLQAWQPDGTQLAALAGGVVLVFWMLGAYNRLVALRGAIGRAWAQADELLQRRSALVRGLVAELRAPMAAEAGALDAWLAALDTAGAAADALRARPVAAARAAQVAASQALLAAAGARVLALLETQAELRSRPAVAGPLQELREVEGRLPFARQLYNAAAEAYDRALRQFPTRLLAGVYRFEAAGRV